MKYRLNPNRLWVRYLFGLTIIFVLIFISHQTSLSVISTGKRDAYLIRLSGEQSLLSQQMNLAAYKYRWRPTEEFKEDMSRWFTTFKSAHQILMDNIHLSDQLALHYTGDGENVGVDNRVKEFIGHLDAMLTARPYSNEFTTAFYNVENSVKNGLLSDLNGAVAIFEVLAKDNVDYLTRLQNITLLTSAIILLLEFMFIFMPTQKAVVRAIARLEHHKRTLRRARFDLASTNKQLNESYDKMEHAALHDTLTGLANRRFLERELSSRIEKYASDDGEMAVMHIDLDNFKIVNDTLGHAAGDYLLEHAAKLFKTHARTSDFISRVGGDEFVILTDNNICRQTASQIADRLTQAFAQPVNWDGYELNISASIGVDIFYPKDKQGNNCVSEILTHADVALYLAKANGRNRYEFFSNDHYQKFLKQTANGIKKAKLA